MADYLNDEREQGFMWTVVLSFIIIMTGIYFAKPVDLTGLAFVVFAFWAGFYGKELSKGWRVRESAKAGFDPRIKASANVKVEGEFKPPQETSDGPPKNKPPKTD